MYSVQVPNGAYGHFLLGRIAKLSNRHEKAVSHFERCLLLNPMMWSAFEELCSLGAQLESVQYVSPFSPADKSFNTGVPSCF